MHTARKVFGGAGAIMLTGLITLVSMMKTLWVNNHPLGAQWLGIALLVGAIACFIFWITAHEEPQTDTKNEGNSAGRDNTGTQINRSIIGDAALDKILMASSPAPAASRLHIQRAEYFSVDDRARKVVVTECLRRMIVDDQLDIEIHNHNFIAGGKNYVPKDPHPNHRKKLFVVYSFNSGPLQVVEKMEEETLSIPQVHPTKSAPKAAIPQLELKFSSANVNVFDEVVRFSESENVKCRSITVHNKPGKEGEAAFRADSISARLTFRHDNSSSVISVDRACWIGSIANEIFLHPGDTAHLLFGIPNEKEWVTFDNPNRQASGGWPQHDMPLRQVGVSLFVGAGISGEVNIIAHQGKHSTTLATRKFVISVTGPVPFLNVRWTDEG